MVIWSPGEGEGGLWIRSGAWQSSAKSGHVGVIEVNHRLDDSRAGMEIIGVISKEFQAQGNCL